MGSKRKTTKETFLRKSEHIILGSFAFAIRSYCEEVCEYVGYAVGFKIGCGCCGNEGLCNAAGANTFCCNGVPIRSSGIF